MIKHNTCILGHISEEIEYDAFKPSLKTKLCEWAVESNQHLFSIVKVIWVDLLYEALK